MSISQRDFGHTVEGRDVTLYTITNSNGNSVSIMNYGATIQAINIKDAAGDMIDCCLGYNSIEEYEKYTDFHGACIGRVGNRIGRGQFTLNGQTYALAVNNGPNHLHGGLKGFDKQMFQAVIENDHKIVFSRLSPNMEEGYPGDLQVSVGYTFDNDNKLIIEYSAYSNADTIVNLTNHTYFNLSGEGDGTILDHMLEIQAASFTEIDANVLPTGRILDVTGTPMDFRTAKTIGQDIEADDEQLHLAGGYDHNFCLDGEGMRTFCTLESPKTHIKMSVSTDMPGVQIYTGNFITEVPGKSGRTYLRYGGVAIETQLYPDALAHAGFPSPVLKAGQPYRSSTIYEFIIQE